MTCLSSCPPCHSTSSTLLRSPHSPFSTPSLMLPPFVCCGPLHCPLFFTHCPLYAPSPCTLCSPPPALILHHVPCALITHLLFSPSPQCSTPLPHFSSHQSADNFVPRSLITLLIPSLSCFHLSCCFPLYLAPRCPSAFISILVLYGESCAVLRHNYPCIVTLLLF